MNQQNTIKTTVELDASGAKRSIEDINKLKAESSAQDTASAKSQGILSKAIEKTDEASGGLLTSFKALVANPLGLVVTALVAGFKFLSTAVQRSGKASETFGKIGAKLGGILNGILAVAEPLVEFLGDKLLSALNDPKQAFIDLGNAIKQNFINRVEASLVLGKALSKLFKGDFKGAAKDATDGFVQLTTGITNATDKAKEFGKEAVENFNKAAVATNNLANAEKTLARNRIAAEKQQLTSLRLAEEQRQIRDDESKTIEERIQANKDLGTILDTQAQRELALAQQRLNLAKAQQAATGDTIENIEAVGDAEIALLEIRERITGQRSEQLVNENSLLKEQAELKQAEKDKALEEEELAKEKAIEEEEAAREKFVAALEQQIEFDELELERKAMNGEATNELEREILENRAQIEINAQKRTAEEIELINAKKQLALDKLNAAEVKAKEVSQQAQLDAVIGAAGEAFGISKEVALAEQLFAAPKAIGDIFKTAAGAPGGIPGRILHITSGLATVIPPIVKSITDIKNARFSKSKGGSSSGGGGSASSAVSAGSSIASIATSAASTEVIDDLGANNSARLGSDSGLSSSATASAANGVIGSSSGSVVFSESRHREFQNQVQFKEDKSTIS